MAHGAVTASGAGASTSQPSTMGRVGWGFISWYAAAYVSAILLLISPLLVTLALKVVALVGNDRAPANLSLVAGTGALVAMVGNPLVGQLSDRTTSRFGRRRPWLVVGLLGGSAGILVVALAPNIALVVVGWCIAQLFFNAMLAALVAVLADQVPSAQRGVVSGILGVCLPVASVCGTYLVKVFTGSMLAMFMAPCIVAGVVMLLFAARLDDQRQLPADKGSWSLGEFARTFYVSPRANPDFAWAFASRFLFVTAYAFLTTYEVFFLLDRVGTSKHDVPQQVFLATLVQAVFVVGASLAGGKLSDRTGRRKVFVLAAAVTFGAAMFVLAMVTSFDEFLVAMVISGIGLGAYVAVDLALVVDVLPDRAHAAKDLGVANIASALPYSIAPAIAPAILAVGSYGTLYSVAGICALLG
ncbi:MAG: MFS transporter, partial [Actinomycetota bacterium]|nr:MFS transporter [Actinomycetota bacterium]